MSGPMAAGFGLEAAVLVSAQSIAQGVAEIAAGITEADRQAEEKRQQRRAERQQMRAARQAGAEKRQRDADAREALANLIGVVDTDSRTEVAERVRALSDGGVSLQEQFSAFLAQARQADVADARGARRVLVARVLERLELDAEIPLPAALDALARQVVAAASAERAEVLATELRLQVQIYNEQRAAATAQRQLQEAAAVVLEQSLKDLGYAIEEIEETLFVEGGVTHFQRPEWGDYFIRLRIDPKRQAMNFNVVRAGTAGEDRRREDMLAEERWCSEFPRLFETLKARGIPIDVTRLLQAGEAPVQVVDAFSLPARSSAAEYRHSQDKLMQLDGKSGR